MGEGFGAWERGGLVAVVSLAIWAMAAFPVAAADPGGVSRGLLSSTSATAPGGSAGNVRQANVVIHADQILQTIDGFGVSDAWRAKEIRLLPTDVQSRLLDLIFSVDKGAGLTILRHRIDPYFHITPDLWIPNALSNDAWLTKEARKRGVRWVMASVWSPPGWMKTNQDVNNGGEVQKKYYADFAEYLSRYAATMASLGAPVDVISMQNEPDLATSYESCQWDVSAAVDFIKNYWAPRWQADGRTEWPMWGEQSGWAASRAGVGAVIQDPAVQALIKVVGGHSYDNMRIGAAVGELVPAASFGQHAWMTEVSNMGPDDPGMEDGLAWANYLRRTLYDSRVNAVNYWWIYQRHGRGERPSGEGLANLEQVGSQVTLEETKRLWTFAQYSRFVRPGARLLGVTADQQGLGAAAFLAADRSSLVLVLTNNMPQPVDPVQVVVEGARVTGQGSTWSTTEEWNVAPGKPVELQANRGFVTLPPRSVMTLVLPLQQTPIQ